MRLLFVLKQSYIFYYIIYMPVPLRNYEDFHNFNYTKVVCPIKHFFVCSKESCAFYKKVNLGKTKFLSTFQLNKLLI